MTSHNIYSSPVSFAPKWYVRSTFMKHICYCPRELRTVRLDVIELIPESPKTSFSKINNILNVSNFPVFNIVKGHQLYPFHIQRVSSTS